MNLEQSFSDYICSAQLEMTTCNDVRMTLNQLDDNTNLGQLPSLDEHIDVTDILRIDSSSLVQEGYKPFNDIPERVQNQTMDIVSGEIHSLK